jgi:transposase
VQEATGIGASIAGDIIAASFDAPLPAPSEREQQLIRERDQYKKLYMDALALCRKLELGLVQKRERFLPGDGQLSLSIMGALMKDALPPAPLPIEENEGDGGKPRPKPTGRKPIPENLPRVEIEVLPPEVVAQGKDAFEKIGEDVTDTVEYRRASVVVVRVLKPKFVLKDKTQMTDRVVLQAKPLALPIARGIAGPALLADTIVRRWQDHLPLHRLERIYAREKLELARSTICGWHAALRDLVTPLIDAMWKDAFSAPYLCTDATGVLVQALEKCRNAHFFVVAAPEKHVLFGYTKKHNSAAVDELLGGYTGYLVADAHAVYDHLYKSGDIKEVGCWAHARRYFFKALDSDPDRARDALSLIQMLFRIERAHQSASNEHRVLERKTKSKLIVDAFFAWCDDNAAHVLDETPISKAINYARNQRAALCTFLEDARLPLHNNFSERALRREALGRKNWIFLGSDDGGDVNATFVSLLASCQLHGIEPAEYLRDLFCLIGEWPVDRVLELAPVYWKKTLQDSDAQQRLDRNVYRRVALELPV